MRSDPVWLILAYSFLLSTARHLGKFTAEDLRVLAKQRNFRAADDSRSWGPVIQRAKENDLVRASGIQKSKLPASKDRLVTVWEWSGWH